MNILNIAVMIVKYFAITLGIAILALIWFTLLGLIIDFVTPSARAGWGPSGCSVGAQAAEWEWRVEGEGHRLYHWGRATDLTSAKDVCPCGCDCGDNCSCSYRGTCSDKCTCVPEQLPPPSVKSCPCGCKCGAYCNCASVGKPCSDRCTCVPKKFFGVEADKIGEPGYTISGRPCCREEAMAAIKASIADDSNQPRITVIGEGREQVLKALESMVESRPYLIKSYPSDHWAVVKAGFICSGHPTIYVQAADGRVIHRQDEYLNAEALANVLRKADPNYDPSKDPNLSVDKLKAIVEKLNPYLPWASLAGVLMLLYFTRKRVSHV